MLCLVAKTLKATVIFLILHMQVGAFNKEQAVVSFAISMDVVKFCEVLLTALLFSNERIIVYTFLQFSFS